MEQSRCKGLQRNCKKKPSSQHATNAIASATSNLPWPRAEIQASVKDYKAAFVPIFHNVAGEVEAGPFRPLQPNLRPKTLGVIRYTMSALVTPVFPKPSHEENHFGAEIFTCLIRKHLSDFHRCPAFQGI